jgi:hypothetical protein
MLQERKVAGLIVDDVVISTESLMEMSTSNIPGVRSGRCLRQTASPPSVSPLLENIEVLMSHKPRVHQACCRDSFSF